MKIEKDKGWSEVILDDDCDFSRFYEFADLIDRNWVFLQFTNRLNDFDSVFWDFHFNGSPLTLHYNLYLGLSVFVEHLKRLQRKIIKIPPPLEVNCLLFLTIKSGLGSQIPKQSVLWIRIRYNR